jgi:DNA-binding winged helix-turn-helix (wHTH) protein
LRDLIATINNFIEKNNNIINFNGFLIDNGVLITKNKHLNFGSKEIKIIKLLYGNKSETKENILKKIWGYNEEIQTKVFENTINNIKKRFKEVEIEEFIIYKNKNI